MPPRRSAPAGASSAARGPRWGTARVRGTSMVPTLRPGDLLLVDHRRRPDVDDVVVARFADGTLAVKRLAEHRTPRTGEAGVWLLSDDPAAGVDSRHRGVVPVGDVRAVVLARLWPRPSWGVRGRPAV